MDSPQSEKEENPFLIQSTPCSSRKLPPRAENYPQYSKSYLKEKKDDLLKQFSESQKKDSPSNSLDLYLAQQQE